MRKLNDLFIEFDLNNNGVITKDEIFRGFGNMFNVRQRRSNFDYFGEMDRERIGKIFLRDIEEYIKPYIE